MCVGSHVCVLVSVKPLLLIRDNGEFSRGGERGQGLTFRAVVSSVGRLTNQRQRSSRLLYQSCPQHFVVSL